MIAKTILCFTARICQQERKNNLNTKNIVLLENINVNLVQILK